MLPRAPVTINGGSIAEGKEPTMNQDIFEGKWKQVQGQVKEWWGKLTDNDLERAGGKWEQFVGLLQEKYGYTREHAEEEIDRRLAEHEAAEAAK